MEFDVGAVITGKVTGITKFGAFVMLAPGKSGLVHISEIANSYVSDVNEFLTVGQEVKVKVIGVDDAGRFNLSVKQAQEAPQPARAPAPKRVDTVPSRMPPPSAAPVQKQEQSFEDKLKRFMQDSDSKMSDLKQHIDKRSNRRRTRGDS